MFIFKEGREDKPALFKSVREEKGRICTTPFDPGPLLDYSKGRRAGGRKEGGLIYIFFSLFYWATKRRAGRKDGGGSGISAPEQQQ